MCGLWIFFRNLWKCIQTLSIDVVLVKLSLCFRFHVQTSFDSHNVDWHKRISPLNFEQILRNIFVIKPVHSIGWLIHPPFVIVTHILCGRCCVTRWDVNCEEQGHMALHKTMEHPDIGSIFNIPAYLTLELFTFYAQMHIKKIQIRPLLKTKAHRETDSFSNSGWQIPVKAFDCARTIDVLSVLWKVQSEKPGAFF